MAGTDIVADAQALAVIITWNVLVYVSSLVTTLISNVCVPAVAVLTVKVKVPEFVLVDPLGVIEEEVKIVESIVLPVLS